MRLAALPRWSVAAGGTPPAGPFVALVPGEAAPLMPVTVPSGLRGAGRLAVARRQLLGPLGPAAARLDTRPAPLGAGRDGWTRLLAADPADLARWRAALGKAAPRARTLLPDFLALPAAAGIWVLAAEASGRIRARLGPADGFSAEAPLAAHMLADARRREPAPRAVMIAEGQLPDEIRAELDGLPLAMRPADLPAGLPAPQSFAHGEAALDLREDPETRAVALAARLRAMALPLVLVALGIAGWAGAILHETAELRSQAAAIETASIEAVRRDILPTGPLLDIRLQVAREISQRQEAAAGASAPAGGLALLHRAALGLTGGAAGGNDEAPAGNGTVPDSLRLTPEGRLELDLVLPDFAALDSVVAALQAQDLGVEITRSGSQGAGAVGAGLVLALPVPEAAPADGGAP